MLKRHMCRRRPPRCARDCVMDTVNKVQENAEDVLAEAKAVNEARAQQAQDAQEEEEVPAE